MNESELSETEKNIGNINLAMSPNEKVLLYRQLKEAKLYFEFGCGGSTILACESFPNLQIRSVDSSSEWINMVQNSSCISKAVSDNRIHMTWIDFGKLELWGYPATEAKKHNWPLYSETIKSAGADADFVLVDGRFRISCFLKTLLYNYSPSLKIGIHDFFPRADVYGSVLKFADPYDCIDSFLIFKPKADINKDELLQEIQLRSHVQH
eukprot:gene5638-6218_t